MRPPDRPFPQGELCLVRTVPSRPRPKASLSSSWVEHRKGAAVAAHPERWAHTCEDAYAKTPELGDERGTPISARLTRHAERPDFALDGDDAAGFVCGTRLPPDSLRWEGLTPDPGAESTREYPDRTASVCELLMHARWRRSRMAPSLFDAFLAPRWEERSADLVAADNDVVIANYARYGFRPIGRMEPGWQPQVMITRHLNHH